MRTLCIEGVATLTAAVAIGPLVPAVAVVTPLSDSVITAAHVRASRAPKRSR